MEFPESARNHVCVAGAGPAGVMLSLILARNGIPVSLLEGQADFDRKFRGDTLHASSLEILQQLDLAAPILAISNARVEKLQLAAGRGLITIADFSRLDTPYPYVALIPQERFLKRLVEEAGKFSHFRLLYEATVTDLVREDGKVCGVRYVHEGDTREMRACLVIGADGRGSTVRDKAGLKLSRTSPPMDVLWFTVPRDRDSALGAVAGRFGAGTMMAMIDRGEEWQIGFVILKGSYRALREAGMEAFRAELRGLAPELGDSLSSLREWSQCAILSVVTGRVDRWHQPGLLLIGDAAHVMSPVGGVGINYAIQDAVAAANELVEALSEGEVTEDRLASVQRRREPAIRFIQSVQGFIQSRIIAAALKSDRPFVPPLPLRVMSRFPIFRKQMARILAYGSRPELLKPAVAGSRSHI